MNMSGGVGAGMNSTAGRLAQVDQSKALRHFIQPEAEERRGVKRTSAEMVRISVTDPRFSITDPDPACQVIGDPDPSSFPIRHFSPDVIMDLRSG